MTAREIGLITAGLVITSICYLYLHDQSAKRDGSLASAHFQILEFAMSAEARSMMAEKTGGAVQSTVLAGSKESQAMDRADIDYRWEIAPIQALVSSNEMRSIALEIEKKLSAIAGGEQQRLCYYYPHAQIKVQVLPADIKVFDGQDGMVFRPGITLSLKCNN